MRRFPVKSRGRVGRVVAILGFVALVILLNVAAEKYDFGFYFY